MPKPPSKTSLDAQADQALAAVRDMRGELVDLCGEDDRLLVLGDAMAVILREQFPGEPALGRIALAVTGAVESIRSVADRRGAPLAPLSWRRSRAWRPRCSTGREGIVAEGSRASRPPSRRRRPTSYAVLGFGESVKRLRSARGLSREQLGARAGLSASAVAYIEQDRSGARLDTALRIAAALGASVDEMITAPAPACAAPVAGGPAFGPAVRRERLARGWSIPDLADRTGLPRTTVQRVETEFSTPTLLVASLLAAPLETSITALAGTGGHHA